MTTDSTYPTMPSTAPHRPLHASPRKSLLGEASGEFLLKVTSGPQVGRIVRLSSAKCTIGSAPYCTLRLHGADIDAVQCVILHGPKRSIVRRWSGSTLLNDRTFEDMPLKSGDRLTVGNVEFQVLGLPGRLPDAASAVRRFGAELHADRQRIDLLTARLELSNRQGRRRLRAAVAKLRKFQMRMAELDTRRQLHAQELTQIQLERARVETLNNEAKQRLEESERRRQALDAEKRSLEEQGERLRAAAKQASHDRQAALTALDARRAELDAAEKRLLEKEAELANRSAQHAAALARSEYDSAELVRWEAQLKEQAAAAAQRLAENAARACELEARERALATETAALAGRVAELEQQAAEQAKRASEAERLLAEREQALAAREQELRDSTAAAEARAAAARQDESARVAAEQALEAERRKLAERESVLTGQLKDIAERETRLAAKIADLEARRSAAAAADGAAEAQAAAALAAAEAERSADWTRRQAELDERVAAVAQRSAELDAQAAELKKRAAEIASGDAAAGAASEARLRTIEQTESRLAEREAELSVAREDVAKRNEEVAARCESLKRHWNELVEREKRLDERIVSIANAPAPVPAPAAAATESTPDESAALSHETADMLELLNARIAQRDAEIDRLQQELATAREEALAAASVVTPIVEAAAAGDGSDVADEGPVVSPALMPEPEVDVSAVEAVAEVHSNSAELATQTGVSAMEETDDASVAEQAVDSVVEPPRAESKPESAAEVLRRLGLASSLEDDAAAPQPVVEVRRPASPPQAAPAAPVAQGDQDDDSLTDYMAQLFHRLGVQRGEQSEAPAPTSRSSTPPSTIEAQDAPESQGQSKADRPAAPLDPAEFKARSVAAERKTDLSTLRELANVNARTAVASHQIRTTEKASRWKGTVAAVSAATSFAACGAAMLGYRDAVWAAIGGLVVAALFGTKSIRLRRKVKTSARSLDDVLQKSAAKMRGDEVDAAK